MKLKKTIWLFLIGITFIFAACKKDKNTTDPADQLPPATQIGANTFGCLVNGKIYIPKGSDGTTKPNLRKNYDSFQGDNFLSVNTYRYVDGYFDGQLNFTIHNLINVGTFLTTQSQNPFDYGGVFFNNCGVSILDTTTFRNGIVNVTRLDLASGIISGIFYCTIKPNNCDTIKITDGRFDFKL
jgi:hypothetical protein